MIKYYVEALTTKGMITIGWVNANDSRHAMNIAMKIARESGYTVTGATSAKVHTA